MKSRMKKMANAEYAGLGRLVKPLHGYIGFGSTIQRLNDLTRRNHSSFSVQVA